MSESIPVEVKTMQHWRLSRHFFWILNSSVMLHHIECLTQNMKKLWSFITSVAVRSWLSRLDIYVQWRKELHISH